jgi:hypothetical protein
MENYYCPRGCNVCDERAARATGFECGACGSRMTKDSARFDAAHADIEERGIAEIERRVKN